MIILFLLFHFYIFVSDESIFYLIWRKTQNVMLIEIDKLACAIFYYFHRRIFIAQISV